MTMNDAHERALLLATTADMRKVVMPFYHGLVVRIGEAANVDTAEHACAIANAVEHIGLVRDRNAWIEFMRENINPDYNPGGYLSVK